MQRADHAFDFAAAREERQERREDHQDRHDHQQLHQRERPARARRHGLSAVSEGGIAFGGWPSEGGVPGRINRRARLARKVAEFSETLNYFLRGIVPVVGNSSLASRARGSYANARALGRPRDHPPGTATCGLRAIGMSTRSKTSPMVRDLDSTGLPSLRPS